MKIYEIEFEIAEKIEVPLDVELPENIDKEDIRNFVIHTIHLGGDDFFEVQDEAISLIEQVFYEDVEDDEEKEYEIKSIRELPGVDVFNWPGEGGKCDCPFCRAKNMAEEDVMKIECPKCKHITRIAEGGWDWIKCTECETEMNHDDLVRLGMKYQVINIENKE